MNGEPVDVRVRMVDVPGARLHVELQGKGPFLLLLSGMARGGGLAALTPRLAEQFTVITHDRRGLGHSQTDDPAAPVEIATDADDVAALLGALTAEPVLVAGTSNGAVLGLDLAIRHPRAGGRTPCARTAAPHVVAARPAKGRPGGASGSRRRRCAPVIWRQPWAVWRP